MSEKVAERPVAKPAERAAEEAPGSQPETALATRPEVALTPAARADAEIEALDREMDGILGQKNNREALMNKPEQALRPQGGGLVTPSVAPPIEAGGINHLVLNAVVPGLGSLVRGRTGLGAMQMGMAAAVIPMLFFSFWLGLLLAVVAYVWSVGSGIRFLSEKTTPSWK